MGWKNWSTWLKFGIVFSLIPIIFFIFVWIDAFISNTTFQVSGIIPFMGGYDCNVYKWVTHYAWAYPGEKEYNDSSCNFIIFIYIIYSIIFGFIMFLFGAIMGFVYKKIKDTSFWKIFKKGFFMSILFYLLISILFWLFADCSKIVGNIAPKVPCINNINYFKMAFTTEFLFVIFIILIITEIGSFIYYAIKHKKKSVINKLI